jgi:glycine hydroxymethyltransferase
VVAADLGFTASHHVALDTAALGGGGAVAERLERARILTSAIGLPWDEPASPPSGVRLGVQAVTRWGFGPDQLDRVAGLMAAVLLGGRPPADVAADVEVLRRDFASVGYCFPP